MKRMPAFRQPISTATLIHIVSITFVLFYNIALFKNFFIDYPVSTTNILYALSVALLIFSLIEILLTLISVTRTIKPVLILLFLASASASYFMDTYNIVIDTGMVENIFASNTKESTELINSSFILYILLLGIIPSLLIYKIKIKSVSLKRHVIEKTSVVIIATFVITSQLYFFSDFYGSFIREHKAIRYYSNPITYLYALGKYTKHSGTQSATTLTTLGTNAHIPADDDDRELVILVVGETARADRFSLNGYTRKTNPLLEQEKVYSFNNVTACGTATAISLPCMFSHLKSSQYDEDAARNTENLLDVLHHAGVNVLWRDNNSDSKHVAVRVPFEDFRSAEKNTVCDTECRDVGMLEGLADYINRTTQGDILIVLHQMGNHGPAYYKRYPKQFEQFTPACKTNQLEECSIEEINNAYDNAIRYTDYFLASTIKLLKKYDNKFETSMVYISDHGESLGEKGIYLHGMPDFMAPDEQKNVGAIFWFGQHVDAKTRNTFSAKQSQMFSHDNIFHTLLGMFEIRTQAYDRELDMVSNKPEHYRHVANNESVKKPAS